MKWLKTALVVAILCRCSCEDIDCNNMFSDNEYGQMECIQEEIESESKEVKSCNTIDAENISWTVVNSKSGTVAVEFSLMSISCGYEFYMLSMYVDEKLRNAKECGDVKAPTLHSNRSVKILDSEPGNTTEVQRTRKVSSCGRTATVKFNYVFSGCYLLEIEAVKDMIDGVIVASLPFFIVTEYKKDLLTQKIPTITNQYTTALRELECSVSNITRINVTRMEIEIRKCDFHSCNCGHGVMQHWWEIALSTSGQFMCKLKDSVTDISLCHIDSDEIRCTIQNVTTGFYCVIVEIVDDRCMKNTVWNDYSYCRYNSKVFEVNSTLPHSIAIPTPLLPQLSVDVVLVSVFVVLVLIGVIVTLFIWRRRRRPSSEPDHNQYLKNQAVPPRPKILLLYPRDCEPFMNMMAAFREMLKQVTKCEVYDCFDPLIEENLFQNKTDWVTAHTTSPEVKVVVIESKCAVLHQMALFQHMKIIYKEPTCLDDLFSYGLRVLREDLQKNTYGRVFVVRIHGFTEESDNLCHITPFARYVMPQNMEKLLSSLYQLKTRHKSHITTCTARHLTQSSLEYVLILNEENDISKQKLQEDIRTLQIFKHQNRDYLDKLLEKNIK
ncbi:uncharacterized protein LOC110831511 isoform X2 [Zootermopsis nevadensis]|uniref:uncharacterized protein LOC110831511 isoform X2 n=1 Tax=Zootermopsis nevadensis TaxID=136037 RepID=UPI000B8E8091|nr:uncharacterized protein LOC110831511 isoform X2 [Zootermopsis nevadensis]